MMREVVTHNHYLLKFDSFNEFLDWNEYEIPDMRSARMGMNGVALYGARNMREAWDLARAGLPREGIEALRLSENALRERYAELPSRLFQSFWNVEGADVDVARFLAGEPECMLDYRATEVWHPKRVVTLVISGGVHYRIKPDSILKHGRALVALIEAVESAGLQTEVWWDLVCVSTPSSSDPKVSARIAVRLKSAGQPLDSSVMMFAFTRPVMLRCLAFNAMHAFPKQFHDPIEIGRTYGYPWYRPFRIEEDYFEDAIYIPNIRRNTEAGNCVNETLRELGLLPDS